MMKDASFLVLFSLDSGKYAVVLTMVERVIPSVEITTLPGTPQIILGVIKVQNRIIPVANVRKRFGLPERELELTDQIIIASSAKRYIGLLVDNVIGVVEFGDRRIVKTKEFLPPLNYVEGIIQLDDGLIILHDLDKFLSLEEGRKVDVALSKGTII